MKKIFVVMVMAVSFLVGMSWPAQAGRYDNEYFNCFQIGPCDKNKQKALLKRAVDDPEAYEAFMTLFQGKGAVNLQMLQVQQNQKIIELLTQIKNK